MIQSEDLNKLNNQWCWDLDEQQVLIVVVMKLLMLSNCYAL